MLKGIEQIGDFKVIVMDELREKYPDKFEESGQMNWIWFETEIRPRHFIYLRKDKNSLSFTFRDKEKGIDGVSIPTIIEAAKLMIQGLKISLPNLEQHNAIAHLDQALIWSSLIKEDKPNKL